ncbi:hypothetical protein SJI19_13035 [Acerihabitans sp. TG2]|uniref:hypothetical protein n=1 Tax=Acerihabitans sp. TG2 TaxID=3096008 RepID=UPI002B226DA4|nr:hypothetical protein [Acerihabitans sp. TG2]MEA9391458.1 hypothetical protein [Acerihabitans sp. TG2]
MSNFFELLMAKNIGFTRTAGGLTLISEDLDLRGCAIECLPNFLIVVGSLILNQCPLARLPNDMMIYHNLDIKNTLIKTLPSNLKVGGALLMENTPLESLPEAFYTESTLDLENTALSVLPENLHVGGYLNIRNTSIRELPKNWYLGGPLLLDVENIRSSLAWRRVNLDELYKEKNNFIDFFERCGSVKPTKNHQDSHDIFAVWVSGQIQVSVGHFFGCPQWFVRHCYHKKLNRLVSECVQELKNKLTAD